DLVDIEKLELGQVDRVRPAVRLPRRGEEIADGLFPQAIDGGGTDDQQNVHHQQGNDNTRRHSISLTMERGVSNRGEHVAGGPAPTALLAVIQRVTAHQGLVRISPVSARLLSRLAFASHLDIDLVELLAEQLMAQPVTGQLQQSQGIGLGGVDLNADSSGFLTDLDLQAAQLGRVETNSGNLLLILQLQLN